MGLYVVCAWPKHPEQAHDCLSGGFSREHHQSYMHRRIHVTGTVWVQVTDALLNFETVKYFCNEELEIDSYGKAIEAYQRSERALLVSLNVLNVVQALIMFAGIATGMTVCVHEVVRGNLSVGDSVLFLTLMSQVRPEPRAQTPGTHIRTCISAPSALRQSICAQVFSFTQGSAVQVASRLHSVPMHVNSCTWVNSDFCDLKF